MLIHILTYKMTENKILPVYTYIYNKGCIWKTKGLWGGRGPWPAPKPLFCRILFPEGPMLPAQWQMLTHRLTASALLSPLPQNNGPYLVCKETFSSLHPRSPQSLKNWLAALYFTCLTTDILNLLSLLQNQRPRAWPITARTQTGRPPEPGAAAPHTPGLPQNRDSHSVTQSHWGHPPINPYVTK